MEKTRGGVGGREGGEREEGYLETFELLWVQCVPELRVMLVPSLLSDNLFQHLTCIICNFVNVYRSKRAEEGEERGTRHTITKS